MTADDYKRFRDASIEATENMYRQIAYDAEERGKTEGKDKEKIATAKRLYNANTSMDVIKTATGFSEKQIKNICM